MAEVNRGRASIIRNLIKKKKFDVHLFHRQHHFLLMPMAEEFSCDNVDCQMIERGFFGFRTATHTFHTRTTQRKYITKLIIFSMNARRWRCRFPSLAFSIRFYGVENGDGSNHNFCEVECGKVMNSLFIISFKSNYRTFAPRISNAFRCDGFVGPIGNKSIFFNWKFERIREKSFHAKRWNR